MHIFLLRHGEAEHGPSDADRALTLAGRAQAAAAANALLSHPVHPQSILASPLLRARQTAAIAGELLGIGSILTTEYLTPDSDHRQIFGLLNARHEESCLLVGHEPHLSTMVSLLLHGSHSEKLHIRTGTLVYVETAGMVERSSGTLRWVFPAESARNQT